ncbi:Protein C16D9.1 [Aphelenchoides avenae]|nr:Protein C16D9.1 [Aphelenchus avenae]
MVYDMRLTDCLNKFSTPLGVLNGIARKRSVECLQICVASVKQPSSKAMKEVAAVLCSLDDTGANEFSKSLSRDDASADCFEIMQGKVLIGLVDQMVEDIASVSDCQKLCAASKQDNDILCKSAMYYAKDKECIIASENRETQPALFIDDKNAVYIENKCAGGARKENPGRLRSASDRGEPQARPPSTQVSEPAPPPQNTGGPPPDRLTLPPILSPPPIGNLEDGRRQASDSYVTAPPRAAYAQPQKPSYAKLSEVDQEEPKPEEGYGNFVRIRPATQGNSQRRIRGSDRDYRYEAKRGRGNRAFNN